MREWKENTMAIRNEKEAPGLKVLSSWDKIGYIEDIEKGVEKQLCKPTCKRVKM